MTGIRGATALLLATAWVAPAAAAPPAAEDPGLPFVYTQWRHLTTADGLPDDHVFAVEAEDEVVWIGTEGGLAAVERGTLEVVESYTEADGLPFKVVSSLDVDRNGDLWIGLFGGGLVRFSGGRFDHWHQLNSGLVNDVVYGVACDRDRDHVWVATTAGANRFDPVAGRWSVFTEKNAPMEEIWNYGVSYDRGKVYLGVWGSGVLEYTTATGRWKDYLDPDGEMEIDLYRDDGIVHVITTGVSYVEDTLWVSSYFGMCRYDGRSWRGYFDHECGLPSNFGNAVKGRSATEAWFATDMGVGVLADAPTGIWVTYTMDPETHHGLAVVSRGTSELERVETERGIPHDYALWVELDGDDVWVGTSKGVGWASGEGYFPGLERRSSLAGAQGVVAVEKAVRAEEEP